MKYKNLTKEQLLISIDRLTRFKNTREKYLRVFLDVILSNLTDPIFKKSELLNLDSRKITEMAEEIINSSLTSLVKSKENKEQNSANINSILKEYENSVFENDEYTQCFLNNKIRYDLFLPLIDESCPINFIEL